MKKVRKKMAVLLVIALVLTGLHIEVCMTKAADQAKSYIWRGEVTGWGGPTSYPSSSNHVQGTGEDNFTESTDMTVYTASYGCGLELMNSYNPAFTGQENEMVEFIKGMKNPRIKVTLKNGGAASVFNWDEELGFPSGKEMEIPEGYLEKGYFALFGNNDVITRVEIYDIGEKLHTPGITEKPEATDSGNQSIQNYDFNLLTIDDKEISTKSNGEKATVLVFGRTTCPNTRTTISDLAKSELTESNELRVIYADIDQAAKGDVQEFASVYGNEYIDFCYRPSQTGYDTTISGMMWEYARVTGISSSVILPVTVLIDEKNQVQKVMTGVQKLQDILTEINNFAKLSYPVSGQTAEPDPEETPGGEVTELPALNPALSNPESFFCIKGLLIHYMNI